MLLDSGKYYLYRHIRLDKNEPFYVGMGTKPEEYTTFESEYTRAFCKTKDKRSAFWFRIVNKTKYEVEILLESDDLEFVKQKEIELIKLYGRTNLGLGTLCNLTDGGDGCENFKFTEEQFQKMRNYQLKKGVPVILMSLNGDFIEEFVCISDLSKRLNSSGSNIRKVCRYIEKSTICNIGTHIKNHLVCYKKDYGRLNYFFDKDLSKKNIVKNMKERNKESRKTIYQYDLKGNFIKEWESGVEADKALGMRIGSCANIASRNNRKKIIGSIGGFYWFYKKIDFSKFIRIKRKNGYISIKMNE